MSGRLSRLRAPIGQSGEAGAGDAPTDPGRRAFLVRAVAGITGLIGAALAVPLAGFASAPGWQSSSPVRLLGRAIPPTLHGEGFVSVGALKDFVVGVPTRVVPVRRTTDAWVSGDAPVAAYVYRRSESEVTAFDIHCTHLGCPLDYIGAARRFLCPCHGGVFDREGEVMAGPPPQPMARFATRVEGGEVFLGGLEDAE
jgi:menaquinol-cytochrome c reductase iron-sulfur subunit